MFAELDTVILTHDIDEKGLKEGAVGAVVHVYEGGRAYEVEFVDSTTGRTIAILTLTSTDIIAFRSNIPTPFRGVYSSLEYSALEGVYWTIEPYRVGAATITINTESDKEKSSAEMYQYRTL